MRVTRYVLDSRLLARKYIMIVNQVESVLLHVNYDLICYESFHPCFSYFICMTNSILLLYAQILFIYFWIRADVWIQFACFYAAIEWKAFTVFKLGIEQSI